MGMSASQCRLLSLTARMSDLELQAQQISNAKVRLSENSDQASAAYNDALSKETLKVYAGTSNGTSNYVQATAYNLTTYNAVSSTDKQRFLKDSSGKVIVNGKVGSSYTNAVNAGGSLATQLNAFLTSNGVITDKTDSKYDSAAVTYYTNVFNEIKGSGGYNQQTSANMTNSEWLYSQLNSGEAFLYEYDSTAGLDGTGDFVAVSWSSGDSTLQKSSDDTKIAIAEAEYKATTDKIESEDKKFDLQLNDINTQHSAIQTEIDSVTKVIQKNVQTSFKTFNA